MAIKINKNVTIQGGIDVASGSICQIDIKTNHREDSDNKLIQLITLTFYRELASYNIENMPTPKEIGFERFNIELTKDEFNNLSGELINIKSKEYIVQNTELSSEDLEIINV